MAYFNHAYTKVFVGTQLSTINTNVNLVNGFIVTSGLATSILAQISVTVANSNYGPGSYGFFDPETYLSVSVADLTGRACCPLILASASLMSKDKIGPFHGGYQESNKSKKINPKYLQKAYRVDPCTPQQAVISIGSTPQTNSGIATVNTFAAGTAASWPLLATTYIVNVTGGTGTGAQLKVTVNVAGTATAASLISAGSGYTIGDVLTAVGGANDTTVTVLTIAAVITNNFQSGTLAVNCCYSFLCGETYYLRIDVKGSPALRYLNHNAYQTLSAYTGCCTGVVPTAVDPTTVYITWASALTVNNYLLPFVAPVVYDYTGVAWYAPGTTVSLDGLATPVVSTQWWDAYAVSTQALAWTTSTAPSCAGMRLFGAYVETKFGNCSFQITDFFEKEPVSIYASLVDYNGDPCVFEGLCVYNDCYGVQGMGFGEQVVRDLIMSESYLQNFFATDIRVREITQGDQILGAINRNALYYRYFLLHSVPRWNNPTGVFDADRYMLEIISTVSNASLNTFLDTWLSDCADCTSLEVESCTACVIIPD